MSPRRHVFSSVVLLTVAAGCIGLAMAQAIPGEKPNSPVWQPVVKASSTPWTSPAPDEDRVVSASQPVQLEIPSIGFDSLEYELIEWDKSDDETHNGFVDPQPWATTVVWDSTVLGGGLPGTDTSGAPPRFLAHTTPASWSTKAPFNHLGEVRAGDPAAITTKEGTLCYSVVKSESVSKGKLNDTYSKTEPLPGVVYLITCDRPPGMSQYEATTENRVVTLQLDQQATNAGSCW